MPTCAFLMCRDLTGFVTDDALAVDPLRALDWQVEMIAWDADVEWSRYDAVIIRSTWDYQSRPEAFLETLDRIEATPGVRLANPSRVVRWNTHKTYLRELAVHGIEVAPTVWGDGLESAEALYDLFETLSTTRLVIKPVVGANADHTYRLARPIPAGLIETVLGSFDERPFLAQPFIEPIVREGEYSLIYAGGAFSHAILKTPKAGDFRVQEEHGGLIRAIVPEAALIDASSRALAAVAPCTGVAGSDLLYARVDLARTEEGSFVLMELELIEPALYFRMDPGAPGRFAAAVDRWAGSEAPPSRNL